MKKFLFLFFGLILTLFLSAFLIFKILEDRLVDAFKKQIIEKTSINITFSEIHFSIFKNFPYGSFILDDAQIFYSKESVKDTLINSKKLSFKINTLNLFHSIYEFPEIIITDGVINLDAIKLDLLFSKEKNSNRSETYRIETKRIKFNRCWVKYRYKEIVKLNFFLDRSYCSGSFLTNTIDLILNLNVYNLTGRINNYFFKTTSLIEVSTTIKERADVYRSDNGSITYKSFPLIFSFIYTPKTDVLQISSSAKKISAKNFCTAFLNTWNIGLSKGTLSFDSFYSINFNNLSFQKLVVKYEFYNFAFTKYKDFSLINLSGTTNINGDFEKNSSTINRFSMRYLGLEIEGNSRIKNFPRPFVLIDCRFRNTQDIDIKRYTISGKFAGNIKSLIEIEDINNININTLKIIKINSETNFSNLSIKNIEFINNLEGGISIADNSLQFKGSGLLYNTPFKGTFSFSNFLDVAFHKASPSPVISLEMERLNLDSIPINNAKGNDTSATLKYHLNTNIKTLIYKGFMVKDFSILLKHDNGNYQCDRFSLNALKGRINGNLFYSQQVGYNISLTAQSIDIQNLFTCFNNFGQNALTNKNISGLLSGQFDFSYKQFSNGKVNPLSIKMASNVVIENGRLIGVSQLKRVSKFLNLNEVDSIHFKTIRNSIDIEQGQITIPSMDVSSDAMNFRLTGQHVFNGEFTYWVKLNLREILSKKYLSHKNHESEYESDNKNGLNLYLKINGNKDSFKVSFDKKNTVEHIKTNLNQEGVLLKSLLKEEFSKSKKDSFLLKDSLSPKSINKFDSIHNKTPKKPFMIEWDEIDSTKIL